MTDRTVPARLANASPPSPTVAGAGADGHSNPPRAVPSLRRYRARIVEVGALAASPAACFWAFHLRAMAPPGLPDPAMHSVYLWDPRDLALRYAPQVFSAARRAYIGPPAAYFRWGTRPGFLVPGRLASLAFGAVPGFFAFRYALALVALLPAYLLAKRVWGVWAGVLAVVLVMTSPVIITAWGTDFPDSAAVSYLLSGTAMLVTPARSQKERRRLLAAAAVLLTFAVWSLATTALIVATTLVTWLAFRLLRERPDLVGDVLVLTVWAVTATGTLAAGSWLLLGRLDFIWSTIQASRFLATPAQERLWHSSNPHWATSDAYLLVLPAVALAWIGAMSARRRHGHTAPVLLGFAFTGQTAAAAYLQFAGHLQLLEEHYLSSSFWAAATLTLLVVLAELGHPLAGHRLLRLLPAALVAAVALLSEALPTPPPLRWTPWGYMAVAVIVIAAAGAPRVARLPRTTAAAATTAVAAAILLLTVAPSPPHPSLPGTIYDPATNYDQALGGDARPLVDDYRLEHAARRWVPNATYRGEQLVTCTTSTSSTLEMDIAGLFHASDNLLPGTCPDLSPAAVDTVGRRKAAQLLVISTHPIDIATTLNQLRPLGAVLARHTHLHAGPAGCWLWLIEVPQYISSDAT